MSLWVSLAVPWLISSGMVFTHSYTLCSFHLHQGSLIHTWGRSRSWLIRSVMTFVMLDTTWSVLLGLVMFMSHLDSLYSVLNIMTYVTFGFMHVGLPLSAVTLGHTLLYPLYQVRYDLCHIGSVYVFFSH